MTDLKALSQVVLERADALAELRLTKIPWQFLETGETNREDFARALYLDGVRDAIAYLNHLLEEGADA